MAQPVSRAELKEWCLRKLGKPVIEINVDDDQVEDRIDEAISYYHDYHYDGTEKVYFKHQIDANTISNGYITIPENIIGVVNLFDIGDATFNTNMFDIRYQIALNEAFNLANMNMANYHATMQHLSLIEEILVGKQPLRYNRHVNKLHIDMNWEKVDVGDYLIAECYQALDPDTYTDMYKDRWLQNYATAKIKYQWGSNLTKFTDFQMPGGVTFNGQRILDDAIAEIGRLEDEMISSYSLPVHDLVG